MKLMLIFIALYCAVQPINAQEKDSGAKHPQPLPQRVEPTPDDSPSISTPTSVTQQPKPEAKSYWSRLFSPENIPNIALFFVGVAGIIVATLTLLRIERQTKAIEDSVSVSEKALILQFRPKIVILGEEVRGITASEIAEEPVVSFVVINEGASIAHIYQSSVVVKQINYANLQFKLFDGEASLGKFSLKPGEAEEKKIALSQETATKIQEEIIHKDDDEWNGGSRTFFACSIRYKDDVGTSRITSRLRRFEPHSLGFGKADENPVEYST